MPERTSPPTQGLRNPPQIRIPVVQARGPRPAEATRIAPAPEELKYPVLTIIEVLGLQEDLPSIDPRSTGAARTDQVLKRRNYIIHFCRRTLLTRIKGIPNEAYDEYLTALYSDISEVLKATDITGEELAPLGISIRLDASQPSNILLSISTNEGKRVHERSIPKPERWMNNMWYSRPGSREP